MSLYEFDCWVVLKIVRPSAKIVYKVFGQNFGGYAAGDEWRLNSGISRIVEADQFYDVYGVSGSVYRLSKTAYHVGTTYHQEILQNLTSHLEVTVLTYEEFLSLKDTDFCDYSN